MSEQQTTNMTATDLLRQQHDQVKRMFEQLVGMRADERSELFDCLRATLAVHETAEEMIVHPAARKIGPAGEQAVQARLDEESQAKQMLADLEKAGPDDERFATMLAELRAAVLAHAQAEETEVFPLLDANLDSEELRQMADKIMHAEKMAPTHPHPHGPESAAGNMLVGPFAAMVDKVRDAMR